MSKTHRHSRCWSRAGQASLVYDKDITAESDLGLSVAVLDGVTDEEHILAVDVSQLKALFIASDQDVTIETNNPGGASGAADDTFNLKANQPIDWMENDPHACPLTVDVTKFWITNGSGSTANVEVQFLIDSTP